MVDSVSDVVVAAHAPGALVAPGPGPDARGAEWRRRSRPSAMRSLACGGGMGVGHGRSLLGRPRQMRLDGSARHSSGWVSCGEWYAPSITVEPAVGDLRRQLRRLVDQRVVVLAHDDGRRAGDRRQPAAQGPGPSGIVGPQSRPSAFTA